MMDVTALLTSVFKYAGTPSNDTAHNLRVLGEWQGLVSRLKYTQSRTVLPNHGKRWSLSDESTMMELYADGLDAVAIAHHLGRSVRSTEFHISKMLLVENRHTTIFAMATKYNRAITVIQRDMDALHKPPGVVCHPIVPCGDAIAPPKAVEDRRAIPGTLL